MGLDYIDSIRLDWINLDLSLVLDLDQNEMK